MVFALLGLVNTQWASAQNVTIKATNGSTIAAIKDYGTTDSFFGAGGFATWQHEQLSMVLTTSDGTVLTPNGQLDNPANNLFTSGNYMQIGKGQADGANTCYVSLSLPKGYRFTGYTIKFSKSTETKGSGNGEISFNSGVTGRFGETGSDFGAYTTSADVTNTSGSKEITRTEMTEGEMSNVLYFKLMNTTNINNNRRVLITLESAEFFFTAEEDYTPVTPVGEITSPVSAVDIPFSTSKVDYGRIQNRTYQINGRTYTRMSYASADVKDLTANLTLFEAESTKDGTGIDGTSGKVVDYKAGTISTQDDYFKLGRENSEQVYYIESPTYVELSDATNTKNPIGYRIVGAEIVYKTPGTETDYYITYTSGGTTYYLGTNGQFSTTKTKWETDNNGRVHSGNTYLGYTSTLNFLTRTYTFDTYTGVPSNALYVDSSNRIYGEFRGYLDTYTVYLYHNGNNAAVSTSTSNLAAWTLETETPSGEGFTLNVYDKNGENPVAYTNGNGTVKLSGLNNDAIKIGVQGIGLVRATLTMQALDPYLDRMSVVCLDDDTELQTPISLSQTFTASDFSVSGGEFYFYLPSDCAGHEVDITFEDLYSKYFDESYTGGSANHTSRINFVKSAHYNAFGTTNNNIYTNTSEASNAQLERLKVGTVGSAAFRFNNADVVGSSGGTLTEYPFSLGNYTGSFGLMQFTVSSTDQQQTKYVFTTDETRYNIAPTTATQHRAYAYYQMIVHVQTQTYEPEVEFIKVYDHSINSAAEDKAYYGAKVTAYDGNTPPKPGYASTTEIYNKINTAITRGTDDKGNSCSDLKDISQLLYIDMSEMAGIYQMTDEAGETLDDLTGVGEKNCIAFIPAGTSSSSVNVAYKTGGSAFQAAHNIVLTDKLPFYSPYDIQVAGANMVEYKRTLTPAYGTDISTATVVLPFNINVTDGLHENNDGSGSFEVYQLDATNCLSTEEDLNHNVDYMKSSAHFVKVSGTTTEANKPYMIKVAAPSGEDKIPFIARINGATIKKTPTELTGETGSGTISKTNYTFTSNGTFSGATLKQKDTPNIFYFAKNALYNIQSLKAGLDLYVLPFRAYYSYTSGSTAKATFLEIAFGANENPFADATGISSAESQPDLAVTTGHGTITIASKENNTVVISALNGMQAGRVVLKAGETKTVNVPAGLYVVNGVKVIVK